MGENDLTQDQAIEVMTVLGAPINSELMYLLGFAARNLSRVRTHTRDTLTSKQHPKRFRRPIHNHQLTDNLSLPLPLFRGAVPNIHRLKVKALDHPPYIRVIVNAAPHLAFTAAHEVGHPLIVIKRKVHAVPCRLLTRRAHIVEGMGPVITYGALKPGHVFLRRWGTPART